jgi:hypothetical protein
MVVVVGAIIPVQKALKAALIADFEAKLIDFTANKLFHFCVAAPCSNSSISCLVEVSRRARQTGKLSSKLCRAGREAKAVLIFHWAVWQVAKPWTIFGAGTCDLCLHVCEGLRQIIGAVIPMDEAMEIREIADIEALPSNLPSDEKGHLMVTAQPSSLRESDIVKSGQLARYKFTALEMPAGLAAILVSHKLPRACFRRLRRFLQKHIVSLTFVNLQQGTAVSLLRQAGVASFFLSVCMEGSECEQGKDKLHQIEE